MYIHVDRVMIMLSMYTWTLLRNTGLFRVTTRCRASSCVYIPVVSGHELALEFSQDLSESLLLCKSCLLKTIQFDAMDKVFNKIR